MDTRPQGSKACRWICVLAAPGGLTITVFSNGAILYRGNDDDILPILLTENAQPGQKFLVAVRVVAADDAQV